MAPSLKEFFSDHQLLLAPMAGVTDLAFRCLCVEQGADLTYSEMVSAKGLSYSNDKTKSLLDLAKGENRIAVQIFGHEAPVMAREAKRVQGLLGEKLAYLDINMGCPAKKIVKKGDGCALMKEPRLAAEIVAAVTAQVSIPVTVKFRRGYHMDSETAVSFAQRIEEAGASALAVHGRYAEQYYRGRADWEIIAKVKDVVEIPVIGNGDLSTAADVLRMKEETSCDAFMIGRAARGYPWIFNETKAALLGKEPPPPPTVEERLSLACRHAFLLEELRGGEVVRMRKHAMWYVSGLPGASAARGKFNTCVRAADFEEVFNELIENQ
ncbi:MAG: tRNA dihydrouridine synthase DusB [Raoultibacter sp.]